VIDLERRRLLAGGVAVPWALTLTSPAPAAGLRGDYFPNVLLRTHEDRPVRFYDDLIRGRLVLIHFTYATCNGICPAITANLVKVQRLLGSRVGRDVFMYSITLKPDQDTPEVLRGHRAMHGVGPGWWFLTGMKPDIELLRRKLGFTDPDPLIDADVSQHTGMIRIGNEPYQRWSACRGGDRPEWIARAVLSLEAPAPAHGGPGRRAGRVTGAEAARAA
jgi:protein SCO1/2